MAPPGRRGRGEEGGVTTYVGGVRARLVPQHGLVKSLAEQELITIRGADRACGTTTTQHTGDKQRIGATSQ